MSDWWITPNPAFEYTVTAVVVAVMVAIAVIDIIRRTRGKDNK